MLFAAPIAHGLDPYIREIDHSVSPGCTTCTARHWGGGGGGVTVTGGGVPWNWAAHVGPAGIFVHGAFGMVNTCPGYTQYG